MTTINSDFLFFISSLALMMLFIFGACIVGGLWGWIIEKIESQKRKKEIRIINAVIREIERRQGKENT